MNNETLKNNITTTKTLAQLFNSYTTAILLIVAFVALVLGGVGGYYLGSKNSTKPTQKSPNDTSQEVSPVASLIDTANWKTYTNEQFHFTVKHPSNLTYIKEQSQTIQFYGNKSAEFPALQISFINRKINKAYGI